MPPEISILDIQPLANGYLQVTSKQLSGLPGHYAIIEKTPCYFLNENSLLIPPQLSSRVSAKESLVIEGIAGTVLTQPNAGFTVLIAQNALGAVLFYLKKYRSNFEGILFIGMTGAFPFAPCPSRRLIAGVPPSVMGAIPLLEDWGIAHRIACDQERPGCFEGTAAMLAQYWQQNNAALAERCHRVEVAELPT
jgi:hypothetical protein